jgi:hypothetical protein
MVAALSGGFFWRLRRSWKEGSRVGVNIRHPAGSTGLFAISGSLPAHSNLVFTAQPAKKALPGVLQWRANESGKSFGPG